MTNKNEEGLRVDRWLWFMRFHKTRTLASAAVQGGHVKVNGERAKSGNRVIPGDTVELVKDRLLYKLTVLSMPARRGAASEMIKCYQEDAAAQKERHEQMKQLKEDRRQMPRTRGKPDKHTRRLLRERNRRHVDRSG